MALFNKKKKFPKYIKGPSKISHLPKYESQVKDHEYKRSHHKLPKMPKHLEQEDMGYMHEEVREPAYLESHPPPTDLALPKRQSDKFELRNPMEEEHHFEEQMPDFSRNEVEPPKDYDFVDTGSTQPIYVKIEDYKKAVKSVSLIRDKLNEAESLIADISDLKKEEDENLSAWHKEITEIKQRLMDVYRDLFEVGR